MWSLTLARKYVGLVTNSVGFTLQSTKQDQAEFKAATPHKKQIEGRLMHRLCPHCEHPFSSKDIWLKAVLTCGECQKVSCFGNFKQWLLCGLIALISVFIGLIALPKPDYLFGLILLIAASLTVFAVSIRFLIRPVPYQRSRENKKAGST